MIIIFFPHRIQEVITYDYNQLYSRLGHLIIDFLLAKDMIPSSALKDPIILILLLHIRFLMKTTNPKVFMVLLHTHFLNENPRPKNSLGVATYSSIDENNSTT